MGLSLGIAKILPAPPMLVPQPVTDLIYEILPRDPQGRLWSYKPHGRTAPRELIGCFIALLQHALGPNIVPQHVGLRCHLMPPGIDEPMGTLY
jgi:hypothetical protein